MGNKTSHGTNAVDGSAGNHFSEDHSALVKLFNDISKEGHLDWSLFQEFLKSSSPWELLPSRLQYALFKDHLDIDQKHFTVSVQSMLDNAYKTQEFQAKYYIAILLGGACDVTQNDMIGLLTRCCNFGLCVCHLNVDRNAEDNDALIRSLAQSCLNGCDTKSVEEVVSWLLMHQLFVFSGFSCWLHMTFANTVHRSSFYMLPLPPDRRGQLLSPSMLWYFCTVLPPCYVRLDKKEHFDIDGDVMVTDDLSAFTWHLMYDSDDHGLSLNRLKHKCLNYKSPTVTLIQFQSGLVVALALDHQWTDSPENFGGPYCQVIELRPSYDVISSGESLVYLKEHGRSISKGLHLGAGRPAKIEIDSDLNEAKLIYNKHSTDTVIRVEVWGCGGTSAALDQHNHKKWEAKEAEKRKKVQRPVDWHDNPDRSILEMGGVQVAHGQKSQ